ncbi:hypothetical protein AALP_AA3G120900 [Arabis alpina]|uniref:Uncharacterized protein n=1 Tax=Arabis alpina TaxID=50452 RepID=A0A087H8P4_ARAAL|nr:hypothetical protein AALP_AA3G120900 [Arabis alpina]
MPTNVLRSAIIAQATRGGGRSVASRRNFSSAANRSGTPVRDKMIQFLGLAVGAGTSYYLYGDYVSNLEAKRQKVNTKYNRHCDPFATLLVCVCVCVCFFQLMSEYKGHSRGITDLREKMWPRLKKKSEPARRMWSGVKEKIWTGRGEEMWSDLREKMLSDRKP